MASTINASNTGFGGIVSTGDSSGSLALQAGGTTIATISSTGLTMNSGNIVQASTAAPAFSAYLGSTQAISASTATKVNFDTELFDTNNNFDTTNKRFLPTVAGYYQVNAYCYGNASGYQEVYLYKNGALLQKLSYSYPAAVQANGGSCLVSLNGSTDYIEIYIFTTGTPTLLSGATGGCYFQAFLARSA